VIDGMNGSCGFVAIERNWPDKRRIRTCKRLASA
jgi:hypothetical protein